MIYRMKISVVKYTDIDALHRANSFTTGHESKMSLHTAYKLGHSPVRTQRFYIYLEDIPLFVASQLVRSHVGVQWYQRSKRTDRGGLNFIEECQRIDNDLNEIHDSILHDRPLFTDDIERIQADVLDLTGKYDRYAPTSLMGDINSEEIINTSAKRLCAKASPETREIWEQVLQEVTKVDPALVLFCVKPCVAHGVCRESKPCGFMKSDLYRKLRDMYKSNFTTKE